MGSEEFKIVVTMMELTSPSPELFARILDGQMGHERNIFHVAVVSDAYSCVAYRFPQVALDSKGWLRVTKQAADDYEASVAYVHITTNLRPDSERI